MKIKIFLKNDLKLIRRDIILIMMVGFALYLGLILRFLLPWANVYLAEIGLIGKAGDNSRLSSYFPLIMSFLNLWTCAILGGTVISFIILSEKDEETMKALFTSPMSPLTYLNFRISIASIVSFLMILLVFYLANIGIMSLHIMVLLAFGASLTAPIVMLFLVIISDGRIQGMNYSKFMSFAGFLILVSWWVGEPQQFLFGLFPPFLISKAYWLALESGGVFKFEWILYLIVGIILQALVILFLRNLFIKRIYKTL